MGVLLFGACSGTPSLPFLGQDGGFAEDGGPVCEPACQAEVARCEGGRCVCAEGHHLGGGDGGLCLPQNSCSPGFAIPVGGSDCLPLEEACDDRNPCTRVTGWTGGLCRYANVTPGTRCEGPPTQDPCVDHYACQMDRCMPQRPVCTKPRPIVFMHGVNGSPSNWDTMIQRLIADGWPAEYLYAVEVADPSWGCNVDNAQVIKQTVERALAETCQPRVDLVAHSMGTLSSRYYVKNLGGHEVINTYLTLGGMHHGLTSSCFAPDFLNVCVWKEICRWGDFVGQLNEDPALPGNCNWVSIYSTADETIPTWSSEVEGAENIVFDGVAHEGVNGLLDVEAVYAEVKRVLLYDCW